VYLKDAKAVINGEWLKPGLVLEGEYKGRKVQCGIQEGRTPAAAFLKIKNKKITPEPKSPEDGWVTDNNLIAANNNSLVLTPVTPVRGFFNKRLFIERLERMTQFCEQVERNEEILVLSQNPSLDSFRFPCKSKLLEHSGLPETRSVSAKNDFNFPIGTKILVFSCNNEASINAASAISFDYGFCIECQSLKDVEDFLKKIGIKRPIYILTDKTLELFKVTSYPALIIVKEDGFQIQEGF
jgi:hypothetical protein